MNKCPRCNNEHLTENQNFCQICGLKLSMSNDEAISQLESLIADCKEFESVNPTEKDVQALELGIAALKETAQEVPVQEQFVGECDNCGYVNTINLQLPKHIVPKFCTQCGCETKYIKKAL